MRYSDYDERDNMTDLDDKLKEILERWDERGWSASVGVESAMVAELKQAFAEEPPQVKYITDNAKKEGTYTAFMTGKEWLDRFTEELPIPDDNGAVPWSQLLEAAKRASGVKDNG